MQDERERRIEQARAALERSSYPRLHMFLLVALTGAAGFLASYALRRAGLDTMWLRYLLSFVLAYVVFLGLLWCWMRTRARDYEDAPEDAIDAADLLPDQSESGAAASESALGAATELEALPVLALAGLIALLVSLVVLISSMVTAAPLLFAELLVDGALSASLYRRLQGVDRNHWLESALRRTTKPFLVVGAVVTLAGLAMGVFAPGAHSLGEVLVAIRS